MARTIRKMAHDLHRHVDLIQMLSNDVFRLTEIIKEQHFDDPKMKECAKDCHEATGTIAESILFIKKYLQEVNAEADRENIPKDS